MRKSLKEVSFFHIDCSTKPRALTNSELPKISIITPSFNQGNFLEDCIRSVLGQNYPNLEYIIIDGDSQDHTLRVIRKYEKYLNYWISEPDRGQSDAINKGLVQAQGDIINWLNADDLYEKNTLWRVAEVYQKTQAQVICGRCRVFQSPTTFSHITQGTDVYPDNLAQTIAWARTDQPATFFHREAIQKMGELDIDLHYLMDRDWWIKYLLHFGLEKVSKISDILVSFRLHKESKTVNKWAGFQLDRDSYFHAFARQNHLEDYARFLAGASQLHQEYHIKNLPPIDPDLAQAILDYYLLLNADELYAHREYAQALEYLNFIRQESLDERGQNLWKKIAFRSRYVPRRLIPILRKIKRLLALR